MLGRGRTLSRKGRKAGNDEAIEGIIERTLTSAFLSLGMVF